MGYNKLLSKTLSTLEQTFTDANFYLQSVAILACIGTALLFYKLAKKIIALAIKDDDQRKPAVKIFNKFFLPLLLPIITVFCLSIGAVIFDNFLQDGFLFFTTIQLTALFIFLRFLRIIFASSFIANIAGFFLIPAIILNIFGLLEPTILFLDQFAINLGKVRISIYTFIQAFVILSVVFWLSGIFSKKSKEFFVKKPNIKASTKGIITKVIDILTYFVVFIIILKVFGIDMTAFAVIGGAVGVGIGFGLQKISSNFISGIILLLEKSIEVGDLVDLENGNIYGTITHFGGRYTLIETFDGQEIMVPNEDFITGKVTNWTYNNNRGRIEIDLKISYDSDLKKAQELTAQSAQEHSRCLN